MALAQGAVAPPMSGYMVASDGFEVAAASGDQAPDSDSLGDEDSTRKVGGRLQARRGLEGGPNTQQNYSAGSDQGSWKGAGVRGSAIRVTAVMDVQGIQRVPSVRKN